VTPVVSHTSSNTGAFVWDRPIFAGASTVDEYKADADKDADAEDVDKVAAAARGCTVGPAENAPANPLADKIRKETHNFIFPIYTVKIKI
jgi:hypothetical protein